MAENGVQWLPSLIRDMEQFFDTHGSAPVRAALDDAAEATTSIATFSSAVR